MANLPTYAPLPPPYRLYSEWAKERPYAVFSGLDTPLFALGGANIAGPPEDIPERFEQFLYGPKFQLTKFKLTTTNSKLRPYIKDSYGSLPFRALEERRLPAAIKQRWEVSVAASISAEWRWWFRKLDPVERDLVVQDLFNRTKDKFWVGLWLDYEEWSEPPRTRHVAAAVRAQDFIEREYIKKTMEELMSKVMEVRSSPHLQRYLAAESPEPLSAPITSETIASLRLRVAPSYFRLPNHASHFATNIFRDHSYEEAMAKANFNSWVQEAKVVRVIYMPDFVKCGALTLHKDEVPRKLSWLKKDQRATRKRKRSER